MDILREALMHAMQALSQLSYAPTRKVLYLKAKSNLVPVKLSPKNPNPSNKRSRVSKDHARPSRLITWPE
jgi:hypothetical protein